MKSASHFIGTPTELTDALCSLSGEKISPKKISQRILQNRDALMDAGITFDIRRSNGKRLIELHRADGDDSADKSGASIDTPNIVPVDPVCGGLDAEALPLGEASKASGYTPVTLGGALPHTPTRRPAGEVTKGENNTMSFSARLRFITLKISTALLPESEMF